MRAPVDWVDVTGWGVFKGHAIPVDVARFIAEKINLYAVCATVNVAEAGKVDPIFWEAFDRIKARVLDFRDTRPEDDETWESWYYASFDLLSESISDIASEFTSSVNYDGRVRKGIEVKS